MDYILNPFYAILIVIALWGIIYFLLEHVIKIKSKSWVRLEYFWIIVGFLGVLSIIIEADKRLKKNRLIDELRWINKRCELLIQSTSRPNNCMTFQNTGLYSDNEFDLRQNEADKICNWLKDVTQTLEETKTLNYTQEIIIPDVILNYYNDSYSVQNTKKRVNEINSDIRKISKDREDIESQLYAQFQNSIGLILLLVAFGIRLAIVTKKVKTLRD